MNGKKETARIEVLSPEKARDVFAIERKRAETMRKTLLKGERDWLLSPDDEGNPFVLSEFAKARELHILKEVRGRLDRMQAEALKAGKRALTNEEYDTRLEREIHDSKYFPVLFVSAPHVEREIHASFPGEPTPLMYATSVLDRYLRVDEFPSLHVPEVKAVLNPGSYTLAFEKQLREYVERWRPRVVGISNISEGHYYAIKIAQIVKDLSPQTIVIMGGSHEDGTNPEVYSRAVQLSKSKEVVSAPGVPKPRPEVYNLSAEQLQRMETLRTLATRGEKTLIDFVIAGDAPYVLMELMKIIADHPQASTGDLKKIILKKRIEFSKIEGSGNIFFYSKDSTTIESISLSGTPLDRNKLPFIFRGRLTEENRFPVFGGKKTAQMMACDGCKYACDFCRESADSVLYQVPKLEQRDPQNVIKEIALLHEQGYEAIFFDDSTFTQSKRGTNDLLNLMIEKRKEGVAFEWGCQTTIKDVDPELLHKMHEAGCTYIYFGLEQAEPGEGKVQKVIVALPTLKGITWAEQFRLVCAWCKDANIRVGTSLQFGLTETPDQRKGTIDLVAEMYREGILANNSVALNINTPYPGTEEWVELMKRSEKRLPDFRERLQRHPRFETAHQFATLAWETADEIYSYARSHLGEGLVGVRFSNEAIQAHIMKFRQAFSRDFYFDDALYQEYLEGRKKGVHLNAASLSVPFSNARMIAKNMFEHERELNEAQKRVIFSDARRKAAELVNLPDVSGVVLARNTTEAASFVYWLAGLKEGDKIILTNSEHLSLQRMFELHLDHGNPKREDRWSTWPTWYAKRGPQYPDFIPDKTGVETKVIDVLSVDETQFEQEIREQIDEKTKVLVFSHVLRENGRVLPVSQICDLARSIKREKNPSNPGLFILIDGAQALGNIATIDFSELGCDAYVATPHKTMKSEVIGLLYFDPQNPLIKDNLKTLNELYARDEQVILDGMFDPTLGILPNVKDTLSPADISGFVAAIESLQDMGLAGNEFSAISHRRGDIQRYFVERLQQLKTQSDYGIDVLASDQQSSFITSFRVQGMDGRNVAEKLAEQGVFISYIERDPIDPTLKFLRVSFQIDTTIQDVDMCIEKLESIVS